MPGKKSRIPDRGHIAWFNFEPSVGREILKRRPALVLSRRKFNQHTGLAIVAPITSRVRKIMLEVAFSGVKIQGAILVHQLKSLDYVAREIEVIEKAPAYITKRAMQVALTLVSR